MVIFSGLWRWIMGVDKPAMPVKFQPLAAKTPIVPVLNDPESMTNDELSREIDQLEAAGWTGKTNTRLHALNTEQTDRLDQAGLELLIEEREAKNLPTGKLRAALKRRQKEGS